MKVGLLGPLEVTADDGAVVELSGRKTRILLAVMACQANRPVSSDLLVDSLWGSAPPGQADASLRVYVHHLRRAVGSARIGRRAGGYVMSLAPDELDIEQFRALAADGRRAVSADDLTRAGGLFDAALNLWRGPALFGLDSTPALAAEATGVEELRLQTLEQRFEVELALGRHDGIVAELFELVGRYPMRETFPGQLMRALVASDRSAEAAAVFDATRRVLADELGLEPSPPLRQLHLSILRDDPALRSTVKIDAPEPGRPQQAGGLVPRQLPTVTAGLAGRTAFLAQLDTLVPDSDGDGMPIAAISGTGGIGKTTLALHWAHRVHSKFPDGQLYVNLRGFDPAATPIDPSEVLREFLDALGVPVERLPDGVEAQAKLYRTLVAERRMLIVLDNARDAEQVRPLLPGSGGCLVVVTSRSQLTGLVVAEGAHPMTLDLLSTAEARELLTHRLGANRVGNEAVATDRLIECCGGLPLALSVVAARLVANPNLSLTAVADELIHTRERLDLFAGDDAATDVRAVFSWSYRILGEQAARLFRLAGMHPGGDIGALAAAHLVGLSPVQARPLLTQLVRAHLLTEQAPGRYAFHDLLRAYAAELALTIDSEHDRKTALCRLLDYYLHTAHAAALALQYSITDLVTPAGADLRGRAEEFTRHEAALAWLVTERPSLIAAVSRARDAGYFTHCWQLARVLQEFLGVQGHWHDLHQVQQIALEAAERAENPAAQAAAHRALAYADTLLGHYQQAENHLQHALHGYRELDDLVHEGYCRHNLSMVYSAQGRQHEALDNERSTLEIFQRAGHLRGEAIALNMIGGELNAIGEHEQALLHGQQALILHRQTEEWQRDSYILDTVADAHYHLGHYQLAQDCYRQAAGVCQQIGNRHEEAALLAHLGDAHHAAEEPELARDAWQQALNIVETFDRLGPGLLASDGNKRLPDVEPLRAKLRQLD